LYRENQRLRKDLARSAGFDQVVGSSHALQDLLKTIRKVAATNSNVLLVGETGTGKELFAREIHVAGPNKDEKFLAVSCGTRPVELLETQLFGTKTARKGAESPLEPGPYSLTRSLSFRRERSQKFCVQSNIRK
jgi:transcriptional regulator with PAS, ATPase and Fis domain